MKERGGDDDDHEEVKSQGYCSDIPYLGGFRPKEKKDDRTTKPKRKGKRLTRGKRLTKAKRPTRTFSNVHRRILISVFTF